jgi:hypothetical protein
MTDDEAPVTITGKYVFLPNPCITEPCLPGMAYALESSGRCFFLTRMGRWSDKPLEQEEWTPGLSETVTVVGRVTQRKDIHGAPFFTIEVEAPEHDGVCNPVTHVL